MKLSSTILETAARGLARLRSELARFARARQANVATIFALSLIPVTLAGGTAIDLGRGLVVRTRMTEALDAAGLAIGASSGLSQAQMNTLAQQFFNANYNVDPAYGTPAAVSVSPGTQSVTLSTHVPMPTAIMRVVGIDTLNVVATSTIVWGQTKLRVALVLDNTGSMTETDSTGTSKMSALKTATGQLLTTLRNAAANPGDVQVSIIPFSKDVNVGTANVNASWIDWTDWEAAPANGTPAASDGPGTSCPYSTGTEGYRCQANPTNGSSSVSTIPSSGAYTGYICPSIDNGNANAGRKNRYYNGCYNSTVSSTNTSNSSNTTTVCSKSTNCTTSNYCSGYPKTTTSTNQNVVTTTTTTCECHSDGGGSKKTCTRTAAASAVTTLWAHTWIKNNHNTWSGCIMDRNQDYDTQNTTPGSSGTNFPAENSTSCVPTTMLGTLSYDWTALQNEVTAMSAGGSTNQTVGLAWGWQSLSGGAPFNAPAITDDTQQVIILLSDGLNTMNRWSGDGLNHSQDVDDRMTLLCSNLRPAHFIVYTVFVDLNGTSGNSSVLQNCATDLDHYYDLTTSGAIITTFNQIAQQITHLRVAS